MPAAEPPNIRFWRKVVKTETCWVWRGALDDLGYGRFSVGRTGSSPFRRQVRAHRYAWELDRGPIPEGLVIDHLCGRRSCVNPDHLEPVTIEENTRRGGRKLVDAQIEEPVQLALFNSSVLT